MKFMISYCVREGVDIEANSAKEALEIWEDMPEHEESAEPCDEIIFCKDSAVSWCVVDDISDEQKEYEEEYYYGKDEEEDDDVY